MKVNSAPSHTQLDVSSKDKKISSPKDRRKELEKKLAAKFGDDFKLSKKNKSKSVVVSIDRKGEAKVSEDGFGDIKNNDPSSDVTREKLKSILKTGAFEFDPKERQALGEILG